MKYSIQFVLGLALLCIEVFGRELVPGSLWTPPLLLIFILWLGTGVVRVPHVIMIWILSLLADGLSSSPVGTHMLRFGPIHIGTILLSQKLSLNRAFGASVLGALGCVLDLVMIAMITRFAFPDAVLNERISALMMLQLIMGTLIAPLLFPVLDRFGRWQKRSRTTMSIGSGD